MASDIFYPENRDLATRADQLINDVVHMQSDISTKFDDSDIIQKELHAAVNEVMTIHGYKTFDDLRAAIMATLTKEEKEKLQKTMDAYQNNVDALDITFQACMLITATAGVIGLSTSTVMWIKSGAATQAFKARVGQVTRLFKGESTVVRAEEQVAEEIVEEVVDVAGALEKEVSFGSKVVRAMKILGIVGVALDVLLIGLAAWQGHEQKEQLITNIRYLNTRRVLCKVYHREAESLVSFSGQLKDVLILMKQPNQDAMKGAIKELSDNFIAEVEIVYTTNGITKAYEALNTMDVSRRSYMEKDLQLQEIKDEISKDVGDPVDHAKPPPPKS